MTMGEKADGKRWQWWTKIGAILGLVAGLFIILVTFIAFPGIPGLPELFVLFVIVGACIAQGAAIGLVIYLAISLFRHFLRTE